MSKKQTARGAEALFIAAFTYAFSAILVREISPMWGDKAQVVARFGIVLMVLTIYGLLNRQKIHIPRSKLPMALVLGTATTGMVLFFTFGVQKTTVANTLFVFYAANMISSFIFGTLLLKEDISSSKLLAIGFALAGLALYSGAIVGGSLGIIFSLISGICAGVVNLASRLLKGLNRAGVLLVQYAVVVFGSAVIMFLSGDQIVRTASLHVMLLTLLFASLILASSYLVLYGFQNFDVNIGTVIMSTEIIIAAAMAYVFFNEVPKGHELVGGVLIFVGSLIGSGIFDRAKPLDEVAQPD